VEAEEETLPGGEGAVSAQPEVLTEAREKAEEE